MKVEERVRENCFSSLKAGDVFYFESAKDKSEKLYYMMCDIAYVTLNGNYAGITYAVGSVSGNTRVIVVNCKLYVEV